MNPDVADGFDAISFIQLHEDAPGFPPELSSAATALQEGRLQSPDAIITAYKLLEDAEQFWLAEARKGMALPWLTHYLPRGQFYNDWRATPAESRVSLKKATYPRGVNLITLRESLKDAVSQSDERDCRPWDVRAQEYVAQNLSRGFAYITDMPAAIDWKFLTDRYSTILERTVFDLSGEPGIDYGSWVQEQYLDAGADHESRMAKLASDEQQAAEQKRQQDRREQQDRLERQRRQQDERRQAEAEAQAQNRQAAPAETAPLLGSTNGRSASQDADQGGGKKCCIVQ